MIMSNQEALHKLQQKEAHEERIQREQRWEAMEKEIELMRKKAVILRKEAAAEREELEALKKELAIERERLEASCRLRNKELALERERLEADIRNEGGECCICKDPLTDPVFTPCGHVFDAHCLRRWMSSGVQRTCPLCRSH